MLKSTEPKLLVERSNYRTWGIGIPLPAGNALKDKWQSEMLMLIRADL